MARSRNPAHPEALLDAAVRLFASQGLGASTAAIAKEAGVSTGTLFVYFETKPALIDELFVILKSEMAKVATTGMPPDADPRDQLRFMWDQWISWAVENPGKRRALAHLSVARDVTDESRQAVHAAYADVSRVLAAITASSPLRDAPSGLMSTLMSAIADATIDDLIASPDPTGTRSAFAFDAMWRALAG